MSLVLEYVYKRYGNTVALNGLSLTAKSGEILGITGPNGSGKSTMIKILCQEEDGFEGNVYYNEQNLFTSGAKVAVVHQETKLFPTITLAENLLIDKATESRRYPKAEQREADMMERLGILSYADEILENCPLFIQQLCEICRALLKDANIFLFDEPNSALTEQESEELFRLMHKLKDEGNTVILVTHRLQELVEHSDRVLIIKDGSVSHTFEGTAIIEEDIARGLVSDEFAEQQAISKGSKSNVSIGTDEKLRVSGLTHTTLFKDIHFSVNEGNIVAFVGVEGSGAREMLQAIAGSIRVKGNIEVKNGKEWIRFNNKPSFLPASRASSMFYNLSIHDNLLMRLGYPKIMGKIGFLQKGKMSGEADRLISTYNVKTKDKNNLVSSLSGGNQQKVAVAAVFAGEPQIIVLEEPTRGVDVQSKNEIYDYIRSYVSEKRCVALVFCTEVFEAFELADKLIVAHNGKISDMINVADFESEADLAVEITHKENMLRQEAK